MSKSVQQLDGHSRSDVIVQIPESWRQRIREVLDTTEVPIQVEVRGSNLPPESHPLRRRDLQAEQALMLAAEAAHYSRAPGCGIVCDEAGDRVGVMIAVHCHDRTELQGWTRSEAAEAIGYVRFLLERWSEHAPEIRGHVPQSRFVIDRNDVLTEDTRPRRLWLLDAESRFQTTEKIDRAGVLSGSFNPLHVGHRKMREAAEEILGRPIVYEMTLQNADKPPLDWLTLCLRSQQFSAGELLLTSVPTFGEKAELLPGTTFVIGWDTAIRVLERRFYPEGELESSFERIAERECGFLVAARRDENRLRTLDDLTIPSRFRDLFSAIPPELFEEEVSSTSIRNAWWRGESEAGPPGLFSLGMIDS